MQIFRKKNDGYVLALGGGGARGLAHVGVLKILQNEGIGIKGIAGTSMGAVVGAMFSYYGDAIEVEEVFRKFMSTKLNKEFGRLFLLLSGNLGAYQEPSRLVKLLERGYVYLKAARSRAIFSRNIVSDTLRELLPDIEFDELKVPFVSVATDLITGREVIFNSGSLLRAVEASSLIPGIVEPVKIGKSIYVDGSTTSTVPVAAARKIFGGQVVAVDVSMELKRGGQPNTAFEVALRAGEITSYYLTRVWLSQADVVIHPNVGQTYWANFEKLDEMIRAGESAARKSISLLKN